MPTLKSNSPYLELPLRSKEQAVRDIEDARSRKNQSKLNHDPKDREA